MGYFLWVVASPPPQPRLPGLQGGGVASSQPFSGPSSGP